MIQIQSFVFNPFSENTYILYDETKEGIIIDPGCQTYAEREILKSFLLEKEIKLVHLLNTHCHIDHVFGNYYFQKNYGLQLNIHKEDVPVLASCEQVAAMYDIKPFEPSKADIFLEENDKITFGNSELNVLHTPGHAPGHLTFVSENQNFIISGDVLFRESIGRTDFPLCNHQHLLESIQKKLFALDNNCVVYSGHGISTTIGYEKRHNPFLR
jgi:glyoxylase-like metal-dependent hydrolase (beta-lactamase superfamily II)